MTVILLYRVAEMQLVKANFELVRSDVKLKCNQGVGFLTSPRFEATASRA